MMASAWWAALVALVAALYAGIDLEDLSPTENGDFDFSLLPAEVQVIFLPFALFLSALSCPKSAQTLRARAGLVETRSL